LLCFFFEFFADIPCFSGMISDFPVIAVRHCQREGVYFFNIRFSLVFLFFDITAI